MSTTPSVFSRIPQPMNGINWEPSPSDYTSLPAPTAYFDTDFANDDFVALWGTDPCASVGRNDLQTIQSLGANTIKMYNWNAPPPPASYTRSHVNFLAAAQALGLSVIVPISSYYTGLAYINRTDPSSPNANPLLPQLIASMVAEVYAWNLNTPGPAIMWAIGNEFELAAPGSYGYCEAQDIATIAQYVVDAETSLGITADNVLAFTSPVSTALPPLPNTSITCESTQSYYSLPGGCAINALVTALGSTLGARFIAAVNSYQTGDQLTAYNTNFTATFPGLPYFYGELGWSAANGGEAAQAQNVYNQLTTTIPLATAESPYYGACVFEFSDELWKGAAGSSETMFGLYTFPSGSPTVFDNEGSHEPVCGARYPVDQLQARTAASCLQAAFTGASTPSGCGSSSSGTGDGA